MIENVISHLKQLQLFCSDVYYFKHLQLKKYTTNACKDMKT